MHVFRVHGPGGMASTRGGFQFGRALLRINREHSPGSRCSGDPVPMYDPRFLASWYRRRYGYVLCKVGRVMDLFSARWDDLQVDGRPCSYLNISRPQAPARRPSGVRPRNLRMLSRDRNQRTYPTDLDAVVIFT